MCEKTMEKAELMWEWYLIRNGRRIYRKIIGSIPRKDEGWFGGRKQLGTEAAQEYLAQKIEEGQPFFAGRIGAYEFNYLSRPIVEQKLGITLPMTAKFQAGGNNCGFYPVTRESLKRFSDLMIWATGQADFIAQMNLDLYSWYLKRYLPSASCISQFRSLDFYRYKQPFTRALAGKKVLVVHPFAESIEQQYKKREKLFPDAEILPLFSLQTLKAVQTIAGNRDSRFSTWFDALDYMTKECEKRDFDIALIGCGAYGFPLAARIKAMGKVALHLGGVTQLLFGIWGKRWDLEPEAVKYRNSFWISPPAQERPEGFDTIEGGCYW